MRQILILLLWLPVLAACKKNEINALPPATQEGRNTLGFLLDGKAWVPDGGGLFVSIKPVEGGYQANYIDTLRNNIWIRAVRKDGAGLDVYLRNVSKVGVYQLNQITQLTPTILVPLNYAYYHDAKGNYLTNSNHTGTITITKADTIGKTVAGLFSFTAQDYSHEQTITITEGRFDVNFTKQ